ncbi:histidine kinase [Parafrankia colletiae]|uniref:Histidine kinase n=1 Tax=Parafrankia colletiae TaxID=573497 RepID=A0A1S1QF98_9ACTN|nr:sensor histidine kinase [Parafrankia colletiae]MCK9904067.1 ATP-binding protein [Frankia sp. Cpl3]OHV30954.1 histidine kinase [Parafrankia colletiae]
MGTRDRDTAVPTAPVGVLSSVGALEPVGVPARAASAVPVPFPWRDGGRDLERPGDDAPAGSTRAGAALERSVVRSFAGLRAAVCLITVIYLFLWRSWYEEKPAAVLVIVGTAAWGAFFVMRSLRHGVGERMAAATVAVAAVPMLLSPFCLPPPSIGDTGNWVLLAVLHAGLTAGWALSPRRFAVAEACLVVAVAVGGHEGRPQVFTAVTFTIVVPVLFACAAVRLRASGRRADDRLTSAMLGHRARLLVLTLDHDRRERQRVLHDTVLNTLTGLAWGGGDDVALARRRCGASADAIRQLLAYDFGPPPVGLDAALTAAVASAGDRGLVVHLQGTSPLERSVLAPSDEPPAAVVAALAGATGEALANVARHAGTGEAWVRVERAPGRLTIRVRDQGAGFQPGRAAPDRLGVRQSVLARVRDAGGLATVDSAPGQGTVVTMRWPAGPSVPAAPTPEAAAEAGYEAGYGERAGAELVREMTAAALRQDYGSGLRAVVAGVALAWHVLMLVPLFSTLGRVHSPLAALGIWCALGLGTVAVATVSRPRPLSGAEAAGLTALSVGAVLASVNVDNTELLRITNWPLIVVALLLAFVTASRTAAQAIAAAAVALAAVVVTVLVRGATDPLTLSRLLSLVYGILGLQLMVAMIGPLLRRTADTTALAVRTEAETLAGQDSDAMIRAERARWLGAIRGEVLPMLDALAGGDADPRDPRWRRLCARQAAGIRRMLARDGAGATLATLAEDIEAVVAAAEGRGMTVEVQIAGEPGAVPLAVPLDLRAGLVDLLDRTLAILPENRAMLTMWSGTDGGSVFVSAAWPGGREPPALTGAVQALVDVDDGRLTVELRWQSAQL